MSKVPDSVDAIQKELEAIRKSASNAQNLYTAQTVDADRSSRRSYADTVDNSSGYTPGYLDYTPEISLGVDLSERHRKETEDEERR